MLEEGIARDRRTWTDDQLRDAVVAQRSWRGVLRQLGLNPASSSMSKSLRKHAARLALDTSHFTGNRRWSDVQLIEAIKKASSWKEVGDYLGVVLDPPSGERTHVKSHVARLRLDTSHLAAATNLTSRASAEPHAISELGYSREYLRRAAPSIAMAWFALRGCTASLPIEPEVYDLLVQSPEGLQRVQVKSTTCKVKKDNAWMVKVGHGSGGKRNTVGLVPYDHEALDLYFIVDGDLRLYLIPSIVLGGRVRIYLRNYEGYIVGDATSLLGSDAALDADERR
jgi:hypothetical protein